MRKPDDSSLTASELKTVEKHAKLALDKASGWGTFPTPVDDVLAAARLRVAPRSAFDMRRLYEYAKQASADAIQKVKGALSKVLGLYDATDSIIHIDDQVGESKQKFLKLHETGHHELPTHRKVFTFFEDCEKTLAPEIADQFEREANNFARYVLFQGSTFKDMAADEVMGVKSPIKLAKKFGASNYAAFREFVRTHHRPCVVYALEPIEHVVGKGVTATVRRVETSPSFKAQFGSPDDTVISGDHPLVQLLPIGRKMTRPTNLIYRDKNGEQHECLGEAFNTTHNVFLLIYPVKSLASSGLIAPIKFSVTKQF